MGQTEANRGDILAPEIPCIENLKSFQCILKALHAYKKAFDSIDANTGHQY